MGFQFERRLAHGLAASLVVFAVGCPVLGASHVVTAGDSLWALAKRYGVSVEALQKANGLNGDKIRRGQKLNIPSKAAQKSSPAKADDTASKPKAVESPSAKVKPSAAQPSAEKKSVAKPSAAKKSAPAPKAASSKAPQPEKTPVAAAKKQAPSAAAPKPAATAKLAPRKSTQRSTATSAPRAINAAAVEAAEELYSTERTVPPSTLEEIAPAWVLERPGPDSQVEKSNAARGGIYPCVAPDPGFGKYDKWVQVAPMAHVLPPSDVHLGPDGTFDVVFHFHGREPIRKEWVKSMEGAVLVAVDVGIDSGAYATAFSDPRTFGSVLRAVEAEISQRGGGKEAHVGRVALSSWSAGFGAVEKILTQPLGQELVDAVILLDGLHSGYSSHSLDPERMAPFVALAKAAARGDRMFFISHSSILTTGYASTTETAQYLMWKVGGKPEPVEPLQADPMGLERMRAFSRGNFYVRGFKGSGAADHCAHLGLMRDVLRVHLAPRWRRSTPVSHEPEALALRQDGTAH